MKLLSGAEVRQLFIDFFKSKGHTHVPSSSLVPAGDPTLLFTNAGMNQFKDTFLGLEKRPYNRAVTSQKCVRAGGKHNDLEDVGVTARHQTFFEMLGNFSFGDYFKEDALTYAWEFITSEQWLGLSTEKLWATIYLDDDEAHDIWVNKVGISPDRVVRLGKKDNFWQMGDTGPCGPCSEIFIDMGEEHKCDDPRGCSISTCGCDRWREFWNNVFMQYNQSADGTMTRLERPGVDTGMGLERITGIMQGVYSNYDTDLLRSIIEAVEELSGKLYDAGPAGLPFRVISDHIRCTTFLIADGVRFSNEGRGYVMRRILRRAVRYGRSIGFTSPFMYKLVAAVVALMGGYYTEIKENQTTIEAEIKREEERFFVTLEQGMKRLQEILDAMAAEGRTVITGTESFTLYDTYGFPLDIVEDVAKEHKVEVDRGGYHVAMAEQKSRARAARDVSYMAEAVKSIAGSLQGKPATQFLGYGELSAQATVLASFSEDGQPTGGATGDRLVVVLDRTPFYAESGGQMGDQGVITAPGLELTVEDTKKIAGGHWLHFVTVKSGFVETGLTVQAQVDASRRGHIQKNHTATHLLQAALRETLGTHAHQAGSLVTPERLRFDFTHTGPMTAEELATVEARVNAKIAEAIPVEIREMAIDDAKAMGAMALFGEKYGDIVRVVKASEWSIELCGGTHVGDTSQIGLFKIVGETGIGSGQRRVEAVTGAGAYAMLASLVSTVELAAVALKTRPEDLVSRAEAVALELRALEKEVADLKRKLAGNQVDELLGAAVSVAGVRLVAGIAAVSGADELREMCDRLRDRLGSGVVVLGAVDGEKVQLIAAATKDLGPKVHAGKLIKELAGIVGGSGGGRPDMAQAGGKEPTKLGDAVAAAERVLGAQLG